MWSACGCGVRTTRWVGGGRIGGGRGEGLLSDCGWIVCEAGCIVHGIGWVVCGAGWGAG